MRPTPMSFIPGMRNRWSCQKMHCIWSWSRTGMVNQLGGRSTCQSKSWKRE